MATIHLFVREQRLPGTSSASHISTTAMVINSYLVESKKNDKKFLEILPTLPFMCY